MSAQARLDPAVLWERRRRFRAEKRRIDFYADEHASTVIDSLRTGVVGGDASSILNRIVAAWWAANRALAATGPDSGKQGKSPLAGSQSTAWWDDHR